MRYLRNAKLMAASALVVCGMGLIVAWFLNTPAREINRAELEHLLDSKTLLEPVATPAPFAGIYHVQGGHKAGAKLEKVYITTHLDEAEIKRLFDQRGLKVYLPGQG